MKVKIEDTWYDAEKVPIMIHMNELDKQNIKEMPKGMTKYACFPDNSKLSENEMYEWMEVPKATTLK